MSAPARKTTKRKVAAPADAAKSSGRPTDYKPEFAELARNYCLLGATFQELGKLLGFSERAVRNWKNRYPDFAAAIEEGSMHANANVIGAHYKRCLAGDMTAIIFWEKNKMGWRDRHDVEHAGKDGGALVVEIVRYGSDDAKDPTAK